MTIGSILASEISPFHRKSLLNELRRRDKIGGEKSARKLIQEIKGRLAARG
jgi:hypothetical protein